ncbi:hypothetical protein L484_001212 [Morus notabilis]|uniref:ribonuclease P n=1 Tax=Morus notabilis TaxID=981085 RepID=W9RLU2_9ROSA|nr:hypothetical protein L484_001212 [Morus notabilis]
MASSRVFSRFSSRLRSFSLNTNKNSTAPEFSPLKSTSRSETSLSARRISRISRLPLQLSSLESTMPLHSAVASARLVSSLSMESQSWGLVPNGPFQFQRPHMASSSSSTFNYLQQKHQPFPFTLCKYPCTLNVFNFHYSTRFLIFSPPKQLLLVRENVSRVVAAKLSATDHEPSYTKTINSRTFKENRIVFPKKSGKKYVSSVAEEKRIENNGIKFTKGKTTKREQNSRKLREMGDGNSSVMSTDKNMAVKSLGSTESKVRNVKSRKQMGEEREKGKGSKKSKTDSQEVRLRVGLDMCSKRGDVMSAIEFYDLAQREGIKLGQYHYTVLLYLCSSAAVGVVRPAKSGSGSRTLNDLDSSDEVSTLSSVDLDKSRMSSDGRELDESVSDNGYLIESSRSGGTGDNVELNSSNRRDVNFDGTFSEKEKLNWFSNGFVKRNYRVLDGLSKPAESDEDSSDEKDGNKNQEDQKIRVDEDLKEYARQRGFEIYEKMRLDNIPMNEAALTSVARMAMSMGNGNMAFDMVKQMKSLGINPRLRSYGPALSAFCSSGDIDKAFDVEEHMLEHGVYPEEPELQALLRVSVGVGKGDKVYYLLHKLRASVRKVSPLTADLLVSWFNSKAASRVGKTKGDKRLIKKSILNGGGGWHGQGWLGRGKWSVLRTTVGAEGLCKCCGEKLAIIDLDPKETENFAESVASIAIERERHSSFQKFQKWLDYYGPFEAVVDGANINAVSNGIRPKLPSKKWPLIVLHNRRITGPKMDEPFNRALIDKWRNADAIYATPTGSNDDWYWLYAAIKFKCLIVTNDEMRDHTFQLLGNDFFPRWKERHQVRFSFSDAGPEFHMPPPCSVVIQESEKGHWHIPISSEHEYDIERPWLCIMRAKSRVTRQDTKTRSEAVETKTKPKPSNNGNPKSTSPPSEEIYKHLRDILSGSTISDDHSILPAIELAEKVGGCTIDFQI